MISETHFPVGTAARSAQDCPGAWQTGRGAPHASATTATTTVRHGRWYASRTPQYRTAQRDAMGGPFQCADVAWPTLVSSGVSQASRAPTSWPAASRCRSSWPLQPPRQLRGVQSEPSFSRIFSSNPPPNAAGTTTMIQRNGGSNWQLR